jgi:hypothetical protein
MIDLKFKLWLNESTDSEFEEFESYLVSWLSSFGEFFPTKENNKVMTHLDFAKKLVPNASSPEDARNTLFDKGFMRINFSNGILYVNNPRVMPNNRQIEYLKELPDKLDYIKEIAYDNDRSIKTLWSRQDML